MIRLASLLFAILFFSRPALPLVAFVLNYDYISKELCINKDNDNLDCHGKCQLKKELAKASGHDQGNQVPRLKMADAEVLFILPEAPFNPVFLTSATKPATGPYINLYQSLPTQNHFHPPAIV